MTEEEHKTLKRIENMARLLDGAWRIPGSEWRIGIDPLIGLFPVVGDVLSAAISLWSILQARRLGLSGALQGRMVLNLFIDTLVGAVPVLGDLFDAGFKANERNLELIRRELEGR